MEKRRGRKMAVTKFSSLLKRLPSPVYKSLGQLWIDKDWPRHLFVEVSAYCNLSCTFCPRENQGRSEMPWEMFTSIIDEASEYGPRSFSLHLFNEPTLYSKWCEAIKYIHKRRKGNTVLLTTNGTTLNSRVDDLIDANPDLVFWSWRPEAKFTKETKDKLRSWGKFRVRFLSHLTPQEARDEWADWTNLEEREIHNYGNKIDTKKFGKDDSLPKRWPCGHLWLDPAVAYNGKILICCNDSKQEEVIGQYPETSIHDAWNGSKLASIRESHMKGVYSGVCAGCDSWKTYPDLFFGFQKHG